MFTGAEAQLLFGRPGPQLVLRRNVAGGVMLDTLGLSREPLDRACWDRRSASPDSSIRSFPIAARRGKVVESTIDDNVSLALEWPGGQQAMLRALWGTSFMSNDSAIYGRKGTLWFDLFGNERLLRSPDAVIPEAEPVTWNGQADCYRVPIKPIAGMTGRRAHRTLRRLHRGSSPAHLRGTAAVARS